MSDEKDSVYQDDEPQDVAVATVAAGVSPALPDLDLQPFTPQRFAAAQLMGLLWPIPQESYRNDGGLYRGEVMDAVIVLWICTLPVESDTGADWSVKRALRQPERAADAAMAWATAKGINVPNGKAFWDTIAIFEKILVDIRNSYTAPKDSEPPKE